MVEVTEMLLDDERQNYWREFLASHPGRPQRIVRAETPERSLKGVSRAVLFSCSDGNYYVAKGIQVGRPLVADRIVALFGSLIDSPVPEVTLVDVPLSLIEYPGSKCAGFDPGLAHGSLYIERCTESPYVRYAERGDNPMRFSNLAVLFGLMVANDHQFLYKMEEPNSVYSHDHGFFLPSADDWTIESLMRQTELPGRLDNIIVANATCSAENLASTGRSLEVVTDRQIAELVDSIPTQWNVTLEERVFLCEFLGCGRNTVAQLVLQGQRTV